MRSASRRPEEEHRRIRRLTEPVGSGYVVCMSEPNTETSLTDAESERDAPSPPPAEPDADSDLERETIEQELKGYPDQPTTS
jgi:hypothetical protein